MSKLKKLRENGVIHPTHDFSDEETSAIESLSDDEVDTLIRVRAKLGHDLATKKSDENDIRLETFAL